MTIYYYQFNIGDYRKDTVHLSLLEHGIYRQLIDTYYTKEGKLEADMDNLMRTHSIRNADEVRAFENVIKDFFVEQDGMLTHRGCDKVIAEIYEKSDKAKASARARWDKENANAKRPESERNADGMLSNNQEPITNNHKPVEKTKPDRLPAVCCPEGLSPDLFKEFKAVRKTALTQRVLDKIRSEAESIGWTLEQALEKCVARGWKSFEAEWIKDKQENKLLTFAERDEQLKRKRWEEMTGRKWPEPGQPVERLQIL